MYQENIELHAKGRGLVKDRSETIHAVCFKSHLGIQLARNTTEKELIFGEEKSCEPEAIKIVPEIMIVVETTRLKTTKTSTYYIHGDWNLTMKHILSSLVDLSTV